MFYQPESRVNCTPEAESKVHVPLDQSEIAFSRDPFQDKIIDVIKGRVYEGLESLRENLTYILGENSKLADSSIQTFE